MNLRLLQFAVLVLTLSICGCGVNEAVLTGHDFIDEAAAALRTGVDEYHTEDVQRITTARKYVVSAFVKDIVAVAGDSAKVEAKTQQFLEVLEKADRSANVEQERHSRLIGWIAKLGEVNAEMREISQWKLRWNDQIRSYVRRLREKANAIRSRNRSD